MDLRAYYKKRRELETQLPEPCVVFSQCTADGGKDGVPTETSRHLAAKLIVEGQARQATAEEAQQFYDIQAENRKAAQQQAAADRKQVTVIPAGDLRNLKGAGRGPRE